MEIIYLKYLLQYQIYLYIKSSKTYTVVGNSKCDLLKFLALLGLPEPCLKCDELSFYENSAAIVIMDGRDCGFGCKHSTATLTIFKSSSLISASGIRRRSSEMLLSDRVVPGEEDKVETKSPGCFPFITSSIKTPKLYTSLFSVTLIAYANSAIIKKKKQSKFNFGNFRFF